MIENEAFKPVVIAPTYNNATTLLEVLRSVEALGLDVLVVNDGSTDATSDRLEEWQRQDHQVEIHVVTHPANRGKADALRTGFRAARDAGYTHAATIDTDGQHDPAHLRTLLDAAQRAPDALVLGDRSHQMENAPRGSRLGWWMSALGIRVETGLSIHDSQCGMRVYPLHVTRVIRGKAGRYGYEAEIIARIAWTGCPIVSVPVECHYMPQEQRISHFRPFVDGVHGFLMHAWLTILRLIPWPRPAVRRLDPAQRVRRDAFAGGPSIERIGALSLWRQLRHDRFQQLVVGSAVGIGTFMSALPVGGYQPLLAVYAAIRLRLHFIPVVLGSLLFMTPVGEWLSRVAAGLGHLAFHLSWYAAPAMEPTGAGHWAMFREIPCSWLFGGVLVGFFSKWITTGVLFALFSVIPVRRPLGLDADGDSEAA